MIDRNQLRDLGWREPLIDEVLREASAIEREAPRVDLDANAQVSVSVSGSELFLASGFAPNGASEVLTVEQAGRIGR
jgi:hypothetical protein